METGGRLSIDNYQLIRQIQREKRFLWQTNKKTGARGEFNLFSSTKSFYEFTWKSPKQINFSWGKMSISQFTYGNFRANWIAPREQGFRIERPIFYNFQALLESISTNLRLRSKVRELISFWAIRGYSDWLILVKLVNISDLSFRFCFWKSYTEVGNFIFDMKTFHRFESYTPRCRTL